MRFFIDAMENEEDGIFLCVSVDVGDANAFESSEELECYLSILTHSIFKDPL